MSDSDPEGSNHSQIINSKSDMSNKYNNNKTQQNLKLQKNKKNLSDFDSEGSNHSEESTS